MEPDGEQDKPDLPGLWTFVSWFGLAASALVLALGLAPNGLVGLLAGLLWAFVSLHYVSFAFSVAMVPAIERSKLGPIRRSYPWPRASVWAYWTFLSVTVLALAIGGNHLLAGLYQLIPVACRAYAVYGRVRTAGTAYGDLRPLGKAHYWLAAATSACIRAVFKVVAFILKSPWLLWKYFRYRVSDRKLAQLFRAEIGDRDLLIYLLYSEPHQLSHFLGGDGVLHPYLDNVIARDWRAENTPRRRASGRADFAETAEGATLDRFGISNMRAHLPFVLVVGRDGAFSAHHLSDAYRRRGTDAGQFLSRLETALSSRIEAALERAGAVHSASTNQTAS